MLEINLNNFDSNSNKKMKNAKKKFINIIIQVTGFQDMAGLSDLHVTYIIFKLTFGPKIKKKKDSIINRIKPRNVPSYLLYIN